MSFVLGTAELDYTLGSEVEDESLPQWVVQVGKDLTGRDALSLLLCG